ncbi:GmrSD restriction endonuclease domain-containing protein [Terasakiella pusilla]|uniref:GmrSD restriction endonuclease domain-containing protein n=1 Tax=Terasakiella pusilla TaxID=64973 RepID=UPI003AA806BC
MKASAANLLNIIKGPKQFVIPIYQRTYSWHQTQCTQLLQDILRISKQEDVNGHFIGSVVYFQENVQTQSEVPELLVIDGQQRLTTITLLIAALAEFVKSNEGLIETTPTKLTNYYLVNAEEDGELHFKLLLTRRDKQTLIELIKGNPLSEPSSQRIVENYEFFKSQISTDNAEDIYNGLMRLFVVDVALEKGVDNPQLIFESLNSTGLDLSQADLIRNYVLMGQKTSLQTELYEKYWHPMEQSYGNEYAKWFDSFMRDYLSVKTGQISNISKVYEAFKTYSRSDKAPADITGLVADIYTHAQYYVNIALHREPNQSLLKGFKRISKLQIGVSYPFLLAVYADYANDVITTDEFERILCLVENYVFRRAICGVPTNSLNKTFANLYQEVNKDHYLESIEAAFLLFTSYKRYPTDNEFQTEIITKDVYNFRSRNYLLDRLENYGRKEPVKVDEYTIEHVMPQNPNLNADWQAMLGPAWKAIQEKHLHTIGNLTLTGYNPTLSDHSFSVKKSIEGGFDDSPIRLNQFLRKSNTWNEEKIVERASKLSEKATEIWFAPYVAEEELEKYLPEEKADTSQYSLEHYEHMNGEILELYKSLQLRVLNIDSSVREEFKKLYIAFKASTNFVDIVPQKAALRLSLNMNYEEILDPKSLCKDITNLGRWGNGNVEVRLASKNELDDIMDLIQQSFDAQMN